ncbi:hypothetical protein [Streptomyces varsoviensis]|uniref:hypothetical protein n=1 Tax=Streptomyces varsoviensis TaxID=67373 RepID=UPI0007C44671|nr:hypothetical protein [Streptomyces varsoviensis]
MKQGTIKTLGVAALGAAFAATAAGTAAAAGPVETVAPTVADAVDSLPVSTVGKLAPGGEALATGQTAFSTVTRTAAPVADQALNTVTSAGAQELLGGLPATRRTAQALPTGEIVKTVPTAVGTAALGAVPGAGLLGGLPA